MIKFSSKIQKKPKSEFSPITEKTPRKRQYDSNTKLSWSFSILDEDGPFSWTKCDSHQKYFEILKKKKAFEQMGLDEMGRGGSHNVDVQELSKEARDRLKEIKLDDTDQLYSLRLNGKNRIWGMLSNNILRILWWDPNHLVCLAQKKHT